MNIALCKLGMTRSEFFVWAQAQTDRYEFDGFEPVAMTDGTARHDVITYNVRTTLRSRLKVGVVDRSARTPAPDDGRCDSLSRRACDVGQGSR